VGEANTPFHIHETLLRVNSPFFDKALKELWKALGERTVTLSYTKPEIFMIYMQWLYTGRLFCTKADDEFVDEAEDDEKGSGENLRWNDCYRLADFLQNFDFKDALIDAAIEKVVKEEYCSSSFARVVYENSGKNSANRKLIVEMIVNIWARDRWERYLSERSTEDMLFDVLVHISSKLENGIKSNNYRTFFDMSDTCKYHEHTQHDKPCYKTTTNIRF
jgi:hypothetical protein